MAKSADLNRERLIEAAQELIEEVGLGGFSVRKLAARLGVEPKAVRWHAGSRDLLLVAVMDRALQDLGLPDAGATPATAWLRSFAVAYRDLYLERPRIGELIRLYLPASVAGLELSAKIVQALVRLGLRQTALVHGYNEFVGYVVGYNLAESMTHTQVLAARDQERLRPHYEAVLRAQHGDELRRLLARPRVVSDPRAVTDYSYRRGLDALLESYTQSALASSRPAAL